jgi:hypothetical protein
MRVSMRHSLLWLMVVALTAGGLVIGCGEDDEGGTSTQNGGLSIADFEGVWMVTSYKVTMVDPPQTSLDMVDFGCAFAFDADDAGAFEGRAFIPASVTHTQVLELAFQGAVDLVAPDTIEVTFTPQFPPFLTTMRGAIGMAGNTFTITDNNATFDFDGDEVEEAAIFEGAMTKYEGPEPAVVFLADFEGHWDATEYRVTSVANPLVSFEVISAGVSFAYEADDAGNIVGDAFIPKEIANTDEDITISDFEAAFSLIKQDTIQIAFSPEYPPFMTNTYGWFSLVADTLRLHDDSTSFDFDQDEVEEPATFDGKMVRSSPGK